MSNPYKIQGLYREGHTDVFKWEEWADAPDLDMAKAKKKNLDFLIYNNKNDMPAVSRIVKKVPATFEVLDYGVNPL